MEISVNIIVKTIIFRIIVRITLSIISTFGGFIISIPIILWAGSKLFRMGLLMYGKRPSLRQVLRALRQA